MLRRFGAPVALAGILVLAACSSTSSGTTSSSGGSSSSSSGGSSSGGTDGGSDGGTTLYTRLGGNTGIKGAVDAIVADEVKDPTIAAFFGENVKSPPPAGTPTVDQIKACLVNQLGNAAGGPEKYPGTPADSAGFQCRDMKTAHTGLGISSDIFDKFVTIAAGTLKRLGVADADIATIGGVLNGTKTSIVE